jgi:D-alanyl-lipoteichoic acid acyltransferase DltB (MBOAT superfamily)
VLFPTLTFAVFFVLVFPISWALRPHRQRWQWFMIAASYLFYGWWDPRFVALIALSAAANAVFGRRIHAAAGGRRRAWLWLAVSFNLALLGWFKYYGFFAREVNGVLVDLGFDGGMRLLDIALPVGISFFTFHAISYVVDVGRGKLEPVGFAEYAVYAAFFPHLVAGPIVRASEFLPQLFVPRALTRADVTRAGALIAGGMFKKVFVSTFVAAAIVDPVFSVPDRYGSFDVLIAIYGYAVQIYADFSAYTDIAIGVALLLGISFPQNFDRPYAAASIQDFWRRWHMTLSRWLRDYLYIPLGGSRKGRVRTYVNLLLTMTLGGLWHGASLTFVAWGALHGAGLAVERLVAGASGAVRGVGGGGDVASASRPVRLWLGRLITFHFVCAGWVLFRAPTFDAAALMFRRLFTAGGAVEVASVPVVAVIALALAAQLVPPGVGRRAADAFGRLPLLVQGAAVGAALFLAIALGPEGVAPFIYFQF